MELPAGRPVPKKVESMPALSPVVVSPAASTVESKYYDNFTYADFEKMFMYDRTGQILLNHMYDSIQTK